MNRDLMGLLNLLTAITLGIVVILKAVMYGEINGLSLVLVASAIVHARTANQLLKS